VRPPNSRGSGTPKRGVARQGWAPTQRKVAPRGGINRPISGLGLDWTWTLVLFAVVPLVLTGCPGGGSPTPLPTPAPQPVQPAQAKPAAPVAAAPERPTYVYDVKGRRDPFRPLIEPRVKAVKTGQKAGLAALEVNEIKLSGIIWEQRGFLALVEAPDGKGYVLRVNDTIGGDARVSKITPESVTFEVRGPTPLPQVRTRLVELRLRKEE